MDLKNYFSISKNDIQKRWEFVPNEKVTSTSYTVSFEEANNEEDAWITLYMAVQKSPEFNIKEAYNSDSIEVDNNVKMTFGLTSNNLEVIKKYVSRWDGAEYDRDTWIRVGEEIGWEPLTACLWYLRRFAVPKTLVLINAFGSVMLLST